MKPIEIWVTSAGPNGWKPVIILEELRLTYKLKQMHWEQLMAPEFRKINPGGKVPTMYDPNTDLLLWESGAIILYLISQYDTEGNLTYNTFKEKHLLSQWLMFQMSQQGPMYGQIGWFNVLHPEKVPSAIERYTKQCERILRILNDALEGRQWLVGGKCTYVDLSFFMWHIVLPLSMLCPPGQTPLVKYPNVLAWHERMNERDSVKKTIAERQRAMDSDGLGGNGLPDDFSVEDLNMKMDKDLEQSGR